MTLAIIGLGYVGLPLAVEFGKQHAVVGFDTDKPLLERGDNVVGLACFNDSYDLTLKEARLQELEATAAKSGSPYTFIRANLADRTAAEACFGKHRFDRLSILPPRLACATPSRRRTATLKATSSSLLTF